MMTERNENFSNGQLSQMRNSRIDSCTANALSWWVNKQISREQRTKSSQLRGRKESRNINSERKDVLGDRKDGNKKEKEKNKLLRFSKKNPLQASQQSFFANISSQARLKGTSYNQFISSNPTGHFLQTTCPMQASKIQDRKGFAKTKSREKQEESL